MDRSAPGQSRQLLAFTALAVTMSLWAGNAVVGRAIVGQVPPLFLGFCRWVIAFSVVLPFAARPIARDRAALLAAWKPVLLLGLTGVASFNAFFYTGLHYTTATNASLLQAATPPLVLFLDRLLFGVRSARRQIIGVLCSTLGVLIIICHGRLETLLGFHFGRGDVLVLCGVAAWALYTSLLRLRPDCHPMSFLAATFGIAVPTALVLSMTEWREIAAMTWTGEVIAAVLYVGLLPSVIAYALFNFAVQEVGAARAGQTNNLLPLFGAVLAALLLGEPLFGYHVAGMALIGAGIGMGWLTIGRPRTRSTHRDQP